MAKKAVKGYTSKCNMRIEVGMAHFKPRFANDEDIEILKNYGKLKKKIAEIDATAFRKLQLEKLEARMTSKMKEIQYDERNLWNAIKNRNV